MISISKRHLRIPSNQDLNLDIDKFRILLQQAQKAVIANLINPIVVAALLWGDESGLRLVAWVCLVMLFTLFRVRYNRILEKKLASIQNKTELDLLQRGFLITVTCSALLWTLLGTVLLPSSILHQALVAFVLAGMTSAAVSTYSVVKRCAYTFHFVVLVPFAVRLAMYGTSLYFGMAFMTLLFCLLLARTIGEFSLHIHRSLLLQHENQGLLERLKKHNACLKQVNQQLREAREKLVASAQLATLGETAANLAHEVNNPMAIALGRLSQIRKMASRTIDVQTMERLISSTETALKRIHQTLSSFLVFRNEEIPTKDRTEASIQEICRSALEVFEAKNSSCVDLIQEIPRESLTVFGSEVLLSQMIFLLLQNSHDSVCATSIPKKWIKLSVVSQKNGVLFEITDNGSYITPAFRKEIFHPDFSRKKPGNEAGRSLSLFLAREIAEKHGGGIKFRPDACPPALQVYLPDSRVGKQNEGVKCYERADT